MTAFHKFMLFFVAEMAISCNPVLSYVWSLSFTTLVVSPYLLLLRVFYNNNTF